MVILVTDKSKNFFNNGYDYFSPRQEKDLARVGLPKQVIKTLDKSLWATLSGDYVSRHVTVYEAVELSSYAEKYKKLPLIDPLKEALKKELGVVC